MPAFAEEADEGRGQAEALHGRLRAEADFPADRRVPGFDPLAPVGKLGRHSSVDARIVRRGKHMNPLRRNALRSGVA
jgi:hypothetical protein